MPHDPQVIADFARKIVRSHAQDIERMSVGEMMADDARFAGMSEDAFDRAEEQIYAQARVYANQLSWPDEQPIVDGSTAHICATTYTVTCLPDDPRAGGVWDIEVQTPTDPRSDQLQVQFCGGHRFLEPRPKDQHWAVLLRGYYHLSRNGTWDQKPGKDDDGYDEWLIAHRFDLQTALKMAAEQAPLVVVNDEIPAEVLARRGRR